jgi:hypothetical protein
MFIDTALLTSQYKTKILKDKINLSVCSFKLESFLQILLMYTLLFNALRFLFAYKTCFSRFLILAVVMVMKIQVF